MKQDDKSMDKIMKALLTSLGMQNVDNVMKVVKATKNPGAALEMLAGIYEEPYLAKYSHAEKDYDTDKRTLCELTEYNALDTDNSQVRYTYTDLATRWINYNPVEFETKEEAIAVYDTITHKEWLDNHNYEEKDYKYFKAAKLDENGNIIFKDSKSYCSVKQWQEHATDTEETEAMPVQMDSGLNEEDIL